MRKSWDQYFMDLCDLVATRSTCDRKAVGAVIVKDKRIISTGYNGSVSGQPHCCDAGHLLVDNHCVRVVHAEQNAIFMASKFGISLNGTTMYCNMFPCWNCFKAIVSAGIVELVVRDQYKSNETDLVLQTAKDANVCIRYFVPDEPKRNNKKINIEGIAKALGAEYVGPITDPEVIKRIKKRIR